MRRLVLGLAAFLLCTPLGAAPAAAMSHVAGPAAAITQVAGAGHVRRTPARVIVGRRVATYSAKGAPHDIVGPVTAARGAATAMSARPGLSATAKVDCALSVAICIHYAISGADAVRPAFLHEVETTLEHVASVYHAAGYRSPEADAGPRTSRNPNTKLDVYLQQQAGSDDYGYCTTTGAASPRGSRDAAAYCVLDNNYTDSIYRAQTPLHDLQVTVAHEYFHAVQFAYDYTEDPWFMEATATWAEDEIYTGINDNRQYLRYGPLGRPRLPMDGDSGGANVYGDWIFFRYLTERFPGRTGQLPTLVRQMWTDAARSGTYSIKAVAAALRSHGTDLHAQFAAFADANRHPKVSYAEGAAYHPAAAAATLTLTPAHRSRAGSRVVRHLAAVTEQFRRGKVSGKHLRVAVTTQRPGITGATISVWFRGGAVHTVRVPLHQGTSTLTVPFGPHVTHAELTLVNTSTSYRCHTGTIYSCSGTPLDDGLTLRWSAKAD